ncbi:MAG TPA: glycosyltransferase [Kofleriaceae bacterium]
MLPGITACLIVRDEEAMLPACLQSIAPWVDEICVVDTGSRDGTVAIARSLGARVEPFVWVSDFSAARNRSLEMATHAWILVIDADEELAQETGPALRAAATRDAQAYLLHRDDLRADGQREPVPLVRMFRNDPRIRFDLPVHESVMNSLFAIGCSSPEVIAVRLVHKGYLPEVLARVDKNGRNLAILRGADPTDVFMRWKLAQTLIEPDQLDERIATLVATIDLLDAMSPEARAERPFAPRVYEALAEALARRGELGRAIATADRGLAIYADNAELLHRRATLALLVGDYPRADTWFAACTNATRTAAGYGRSPELGALWSTLGKARAALGRGDNAAAKRRLDQALDTSPTDIEARCRSVAFAIARGDVTAAMPVFESLVPEFARSPLVRVLAGDVTWREGNASGALELWQLAAGFHDADFDADARIAIVRWLVDEHVSQLFVGDVSAAGAKLLLAMAAGVDPSFDPAFDIPAIVASARTWIATFVRPASPRALAALAAVAPAWEPRFPGIAEAIEK